MTNADAPETGLGRLFEIRFESIGGLGAHAAGQILAAAGVLKMGFNGSHFSSYGSEKKGSVVRSYVRLAPGDKPIRTSAPIESPDVIIVFHSALLANPATVAGLKERGVLIYTAPPGPVPPELSRLPVRATAIRVDALTIANETKSRPNAVLLGALCAAVPFLKSEIVLEMLGEEFAGKHPEAVAANEKAFRRGAAEGERIASPGKTHGALPPHRVAPVWGYATAPLGGVLPVPGNTAWNNLATSRTGFLPVLDTKACIHCGICDLVCPDLCLVWEETPGAGKVTHQLKGVDYRYCKACFRCVESCPTGAMAKKPEEPGLADKLRVPLFPQLVA